MEIKIQGRLEHYYAILHFIKYLYSFSEKEKKKKKHTDSISDIFITDVLLPALVA